MSRYPGFPLTENSPLSRLCLKGYSLPFYSQPSFPFLFQFNSFGLELQYVDNEVHGVFAKSYIHTSLAKDKLFSTQCIVQ